MRSHFEPGKWTHFLTAFLAQGGRIFSPVFRFWGGVWAPRKDHPPSAVGQWWNYAVGAASHVKPGLEVFRVSCDRTSACLFHGQLMFEWKPTARHNIDTLSRHFACSRYFELF